MQNGEHTKSAGELHQQLLLLSDQERQTLARIIGGGQVSRDMNQEFEAHMSFGERVADRVAAFGGSWTFILLFLAVLVGWIVLNTLLLAGRGAAFDPYPFILLNLVLSMIAAIQAPIILMTQNRQAIKDRLDAANDYEVNLKAEIDIMGLHTKLDTLREREWAQLVALQQTQITMLQQLLLQRGTVPSIGPDGVAAG